MRQPHPEVHQGRHEEIDTMSRGIPSRLLNASVQILRESDVAGSFGESIKSLVKVGDPVRCRVDSKSFTRDRQDGGLMVATTYYKVYVNDAPTVPVDDKFWLKVTTDKGQVLTLQAQSQGDPGMMQHHAEIMAVQRNPVPPIVETP
jgi:hypothetical protein